MMAGVRNWRPLWHRLQVLSPQSLHGYDCYTHYDSDVDPGTPCHILTQILRLAHILASKFWDRLWGQAYLWCQLRPASGLAKLIPEWSHCPFLFPVSQAGRDKDSGDLPLHCLLQVPSQAWLLPQPALFKGYSFFLFLSVSLIDICLLICFEEN